MPRNRFSKALQISIVLACSFVVVSCAYTVERKWVQGRGPGTQGHPISDFSSTLRSCVATYDPDRLQDFDEGREYRISGWFVDSGRTGPVIRCMEENGWLAMPTTLLAP